MRHSIVLLVVLGATPLAQAQAWIPALNHTCPSKMVVKVTSKAGGPVFINGKQATVKRFSATYFEASSAALKFSASVMTEVGGAPSVSYTGPGKLNGICAPIKAAAVAAAPASRPA
jgi:hypothetical protein